MNRDQLVETIRHLLACYDRLTPKMPAKMSPAERAMIDGVYSPENLKNMRRLATEEPTPGQREEAKARPE